jgi:hypothetical protein
MKRGNERLDLLFVGRSDPTFLSVSVVSDILGQGSHVPSCIDDRRGSLRSAVHLGTVVGTTVLYCVICVRERERVRARNAEGASDRDARREEKRREEIIRRLNQFTTVVVLVSKVVTTPTPTPHRTTPQCLAYGLPYEVPTHPHCPCSACPCSACPCSACPCPRPCPSNSKPS